MKTNLERKHLVIGLDSATLDIILPMVQKGKLPNISRLIKEGVSSVSKSVYNYNSATAWTTITTGTNPGKHGIPGFFEFQPKGYSRRFVNTSFRKTEPLWSLLSQDKKAIVINVPFTYPPDEVNGIFVSGWDAPDARPGFVYPRQIFAEIKQRFGDYIIEYPLCGSFNYKTADRVLQSIRSAEEKRKNVALYLIKKYPWDFFMIVFTALDRVGHFFWHCMDQRHPQYDEAGAAAYRDVIFKTYEDMDRYLGDILSNIEEDVNVILISDHGMGPLDPQKALSLDKWLCQNGLMKLKSGVSATSNSYLESMTAIMRRCLSPAMKRYLKSFFSESRKRLISKSILGGIDWTQTKVYAMPSLCLSNNLRINLEGRESQGIVKPGKEYEDLRDLLKDKLNSLKSPTGRKLIKSAYKREEAYHGGYVDRFPDIIVDFAEEAYFEVSGNARGGLVSSDMIPWSGTHRLEGIFIAQGPDIKKDGGLRGVGIADLAPTILYSMGQGVPLSMDGRVLEEIFTEGFRDKNPIRYIKNEEISSGKEQHLYS